MVNFNGGPPLLAQGSNGDGHVISVATMLSKTRPATLKLFRCAKISAGACCYGCGGCCCCCCCCVCGVAGASNVMICCAHILILFYFFLHLPYLLDTSEVQLTPEERAVFFS